VNSAAFGQELFPVASTRGRGTNYRCVEVDDFGGSAGTSRVVVFWSLGALGENGPPTIYFPCLVSKTSAGAFPWLLYLGIFGYRGWSFRDQFAGSAGFRLPSDQGGIENGVFGVPAVAQAGPFGDAVLWGFR